MPERALKVQILILAASLKEVETRDGSEAKGVPQVVVLYMRRGFIYVKAWVRVKVKVKNLLYSTCPA